MRRVLTGIKPTGDVHLGNYLGAIAPGLALQSEYEAFYFIADYHAMTTVERADDLRRASLEIAATWLALGLDVDRAVFFRQSAVPEVCELMWILACQVPVGLLERGHAVKAARDGGHDVNVGTWMYPALMAADILLYDANLVPVGKDQKQHIEVARDMAIKVNHRYGDDTVVVPSPYIQADVAEVPGLDGARKMSKSYNNTIPLWVPSKKLRKLVMTIVTDSRGVDDPKDPDSDTVFALYKLFASPDQATDLRRRYLQGGLGYGHAKQELFDCMEQRLAAPRAEYERWMADPGALEAVLARGADRARSAASTTLTRLRKRVGLT